MEIKSAPEVAKIIEKIYKKKIDGEKSGPFKLTRSQLRTLSGRKNLKNGVVLDITMAVAEYDLFLIDNDVDFYVVHIKEVEKFREIPDEVIEKY
jgi:hypothetical protein